jgi:hypothetical protein
VGFANILHVGIHSVSRRARFSFFANLQQTCGTNTGGGLLHLNLSALFFGLAKVSQVGFHVNDSQNGRGGLLILQHLLILFGL